MKLFSQQNKKLKHKKRNLLFNAQSEITIYELTIVSGHWKDHWKNMRGSEKFVWETMLRQTCWWIKAKTNQIYKDWFV